MALKDQLKRHLLIASAAVSLGAGAITPDAVQDARPPAAVQKVDQNSLLSYIQQNRKITYNGLSFDTPLFRQKQKTNKALKDVDFYFKGAETGLVVKDGAKNILVLMPREVLESLIGTLIAMDRGEKVSSQKPDNPNEWTFHSSYPEIVVEENGRRRPVQKAELDVVFDKSLAAFSACNSEDVIDVKKMIQKYAQRIGGATGKALALSVQPLFLKSLQNTVVEQFAKSYKKDVLKHMQNLPALAKEERKEFDQNKAKAVAQYQIREKERQAQELAQRQKQQLLAQKEAQRIASLITFERFSDVEIIKNPHFNHVCLLLTQGKDTVEINSSQKIFANVYHHDDKGEVMNIRSLEPEEWQELERKLPQMLTAQQKSDLGVNFFQKLSQKANPQLLAMASARSVRR